MAVFNGIQAEVALKFIRAGIAAVALACGSAAQAENLIFYGNTESGESLFYDIDSIRKNGNIVFVWTYRDASKDATVKYTTARARIRYDCKNENWDLVYFVSYSASRIVQNLSSRDVANMTPIIPGTLVEKLYKIIC